VRLETFKKIISSLNEADVRYLVAGGLAVVAHGYGRLTVDIDLVIELAPENIRRTFDALGRLGYRPRVPITAEQFADERQRESWIRDKGMMVLSMFSDNYVRTPVDLFVYKPFDFDEAYNDALEETLDDEVTCRFVDLDTLIAMKEQAGRDKDLDDVRHLRMIQDDQEPLGNS
jgi:hypothetical protein